MKAGDKVVCINDSGCVGSKYSMMKKGNIYTIKVRTSENGYDSIVVKGSNIAWMIERFKPVEPCNFSNQASKELIKEFQEKSVEKELEEVLV